MRTEQVSIRHATGCAGCIFCVHAQLWFFRQLESAQCACGNELCNFFGQFLPAVSLARTLLDRISLAKLFSSCLTPIDDNFPQFMARPLPPFNFPLCLQHQSYRAWWWCLKASSVLQEANDVTRRLSACIERRSSFRTAVRRFLMGDQHAGAEPRSWHWASNLVYKIAVRVLVNRSVFSLW